MNTTTKELLNNWLIIPFFGSVAIASLVNFNSLMAADYSEFAEGFFISYSFWTLLGNGNNAIVHFIDKRWTWLDAPVTRTIVGVISMIAVTMFLSTLVLYVYFEWYKGWSFLAIWNRDGLLIYVIPMSITLVVSLWLHGRGFLMEWREAATNVERLKTESMKSKFESLRNQVNPHFLFNSLNALSSLVYDDQERAVEFIQKLSEVYRYVLDHQDDEVVPVSEELRFLRSFVYLTKIRFGNNFEVEFENLDDLSNHMVLPPVVLQMLLENCIKHNEISKDRKLSVVISKKGENIQVRNTINPLPSGPTDSSRIGLKNIIMRYEMLTDESVQVSKTDKEFTVSIPILKLQ